MKAEVKVVRLANQLAARLNEILPQKFEARAINSELAAFCNGTLEQTTSLESLWHKELSDQENTGTIASSVLNAVQDLVAEETKEIWPRRSEEENTPQDFPLPYLQWEGHTLHMGFRDEGHPVMRLKPLQLESLQP